MDLIIHSYGYSGLIVNVLNGLGMFRNSGFYPAVVNTMVLMVGVFYAWKIAAGEQWRGYLMRCMGMIIFVNVLLIPRTSMFVRDHVEKSFHKVDNIPLAFSLPIGALESFGHLLTHGFEQAFTFIGGRSSLSYYNYGAVFGARLAKEVLEAKIRDPEVAANMREFMKRCVILPAMIGYKFTKEQLVNSTDIWGLLKAAGGDLTRVDMTIDGEKLLESLTCAQAIIYFEGKFISQSNGLIATLTNKFRGAGDGVKVKKYNQGAMQLNKDMNSAIREIFNNNRVSVDSILKNNMIINALNNYRSGKYATARAQMHQEAGGLLSGDLAEKTLTGSLALMKVIVYSSFIFLLPMLILAGGLQKYKSWITAAFSLSLWPPLFTILNMVIDFAYDPAQVVSYSSWSTEKQKFDSIASLAAGLTISIPFLAYYMTRLGEGGFTQLAGTIMASSSAATSAIAGEKSSGSRNWDNESISNSNRNNSSSFKTNHNMEYVSGENGWNNLDGSRVKVTAGGNQIISSGSGITSDVGETRYTIEDSRRGEVNQGAQQSLEFLEAKSVSYSNAKSNTFGQTKDWVKNIAEREAAGQTINYESMGEQGKNVQQMVSIAKMLTKDYGYTWDQSVEGVMTGGISLTSPFKKIVGGVSISADGKITAGNRSTQQFSEKEQADRNNQIAENYNNIIKAANNQTYSSDSSIDKSQSSRVTSSYEEQQRLAEEVSKAHHQSEAWHEAQNIINSSGGISSKDMTRELTDRYMQEYGIKDRSKAHLDVSMRTPEVMRTWNRMLSQDRYVQDLVRDIAANTSKNFDNSMDKFIKDNQIIQGANDQKIERAEMDEEFNAQNLQNGVHNKKEELNQKYTDMTNKNDSEYISKEYGIKSLEQGMQAKIDKYEEDRIGHGDTSKIISGVFNTFTLGNSGYGIGAPPKDSTHLQDHDKPSHSNVSISNVDSRQVSSEQMATTDDDNLGCDDIVKPYSSKGLNIPIVKGNKKF